jgi:hypothetical protein
MKSHRINLRSFIALSLILVSVIVPRAQTVSPSQQVAALTQEFLKAQAEFSKLYTAAKDDAEREKLRSEKMPDAKKFAPRFWAIAERNPKDPAAVDALVWLTTTGYQSKEAGNALAILARDHAASDKVETVCTFAPYISSSASGEFLRMVIEKNSKREVQAQACRSLYSYNLSADPAQAGKYLDLLAEKYGEIKDRGPAAFSDFVKTERELNKIFGIGQVAPEIEGEDIDGTKFKLSDYRGKVVVIDFWGDW